MTYQGRRESEEERALRLKREAAELALARRHAEAGDVISGPELETGFAGRDARALLVARHKADLRSARCATAEDWAGRCRRVEPAAPGHKARARVEHDKQDAGRRPGVSRDVGATYAHLGPACVRERPEGHLDVLCRLIEYSVARLHWHPRTTIDLHLSRGDRRVARGRVVDSRDQRSCLFDSHHVGDRNHACNHWSGYV